MIEIDGPPRAWFEGGPFAFRYTYTVYAIKGEDPVKVMQAFATWRKEYEDADQILVWRFRPTLTYENDDVMFDEEGALKKNPHPRPHWKMYCRCTKIPMNLYNTLPIKGEGQPFSELL